MKRLLFSIGFLCMLSSCSQNDDELDLMPQAEVTFPSFGGLSFELEALFEYRFREGNAAGDFVNLTVNEAIPSQFTFIHQQEGFVGLYRPQEVYLRNVEAGTTQSYRDFVGFGDEERRETVVNDDIYIALLFRYTNTLEELRLRLINTQNNVQTEVNLGAVQGVGRLYMMDEFIIVSLHDTNSNATVLYQIDRSTAAIVQSWSFENTNVVSAVAFAPDEEFYFYDGEGAYYRHAFNSQELIEKKATSFLPNARFYYRVVDNQLVSYYNYIQPSFLPRGPELFDLTSDTAIQVDIAPIYSEFLAQNLGFTNITATDFAYDRDNERWISGYLAQDNDGNSKSGVFLISASGQLLAQMDLERPLRYIVLLN
ncbi:hypothetical protein [Croceiramulus getboli]|nr:hypothetical protein P8624_13800 [Flavobacteriaceae bacterium YJPT1-3]